MQKKCGGLLSHINTDFSFDRGAPLPLGATVLRGGVNFAVFSHNAESVTLVLFEQGNEEEIVAFPLDPKRNRTGDVWHAFIAGLDPGIEYAYRMDGPKSARNHFEPNVLLADPYATALNGKRIWGQKTSASPQSSYRRALIVNHEYDWGLDQPINRPLAESIIYELHVRGFTRDKSSKTKFPGTFRGLIEKIPYLKNLGITAVELLPVTEFDELDVNRLNPENSEPLFNYWGYHPLSFFALKAAYSSSEIPGSEIVEFKDMVKALHSEKIEVILDVVYNHTGEGNQLGPSFSMKGIDNSIYYMLSHDGCHMNFSGCGNTVNCNHPFVRNFILDSLRYWVTEMHVDGFRFDLASILGRDQHGNVLSNPPLLEQIAGDPVLASTKLIAEAWDAAGLYQVGTFPNWGRWAEWNGRFRDDLRSFIKGDLGCVGHLATRLAGSSDLYQHGREPGHGINFITSHDGFTLADLVSYNYKHNWCNGENNSDGENNNLSWNCGDEGSSRSIEVNSIRLRQIKNFATILLAAKGVPMILSGDEIGQSKYGNNNSYCQDNKINWFDWENITENRSLHRFFKMMIAFRKKHPIISYDRFIPENGYGALISWHGSELGRPDWSNESKGISMHISGRAPGSEHDEIFLLVNSHHEKMRFQLPQISGKFWNRFVDTSIEGDDAILKESEMRPLKTQDFYEVNGRSVVILLGYL